MEKTNRLARQPIIKETMFVLGLIYLFERRNYKERGRERDYSSIPWFGTSVTTTARVSYRDIRDSRVPVPLPLLFPGTLAGFWVGS